MQLDNMKVWLDCVNIILMSTEPTLNEEIMPNLVVIAVILLLTISGVLCACGRAEYLIGQECCPMCGPGYYVKRHCTEYTSTTCVPCLPSTFTDAPNGLVSCRSCKVCDPGEGLIVKRACTPTLDALCDPLEGHYCTDLIKDGCRGAVEYTKCKAGQYIKQPGTPISDTVCGDCVGDTYSNGSFTSCKPHTQCELTGRIVKRKGTVSSDTECAEIDNTATIVGVAVGIITALFGVVAVIYFIRWWRRKHQSTERQLNGNTQVSHIIYQDSEPIETEEPNEHGGMMAAVM